MPEGSPATSAGQAVDTAAQRGSRVFTSSALEGAHVRLTVDATNQRVSVQIIEGSGNNPAHRMAHTPEQVKEIIEASKIKGLDGSPVKLSVIVAGEGVLAEIHFTGKQLPFEALANTGSKFLSGLYDAGLLPPSVWPSVSEFANKHVPLAVEKSADLSPPSAQTVHTSHPVAAHAPHVEKPKLPIGKTSALGLAVGLGLAFAAGKAKAEESVAEGKSVGDIALDSVRAAAETVTGVQPALAGRAAEASVQTVVAGIATASSFVITPAGGVAAGVAADELIRPIAKLMGADVDGPELSTALKQSIKRNPIPASVMQTNFKYVSMQENMLRDVGIPQSDAQKLRDPDARAEYSAQLRAQHAAEKDPMKLEALALKEQAVATFARIEGFRVEHLKPHLEKITTELAQQMRAQHLATAYREENQSTGIEVTDAPAPGVNVPKAVGQKPDEPPRTAAASRG